MAINSKTNSHPCFDHQAHSRVGRLHLPVARRCNIGCNFCDRRVSDCYSTSRPGLASRIISPQEAVKAVRDGLKEYPEVEVVGIAGPGEPLFNEETFEALRAVKEKFPDLRLCVCTNGLLLPEKAHGLKELGVDSVTVTVNAVNPELGARINSYCMVKGKKAAGLEAARQLIENQLKGIEIAARLGMRVKVNTVLIPEINGGHVLEIARAIKQRGADIMNIMPLIPLGRLKDSREPTCEELIHARETCEDIIPQFRLCRQCRADACGVPGLE